MTKGDMIRNFSNEVLAEWLTNIEEKAVEHLHAINSLSHEEIKKDWMEFLKEEN